MAETKHTPAPWTVRGKDIVDGDGGLVCMVTDSYERGKAARERDAADRKLIAAAPRLLFELQRMVKIYDGMEDGNGEPCPAVAAAKDALALAVGEG